jgi:hypothetical protein
VPIGATSGARESVTFELDWICWLLGPARVRVADVHDAYLGTDLSEVPSL